jgi:hypothetical protein
MMVAGIFRKIGQLAHYKITLLSPIIHKWEHPPPKR